MRYFSRTLLLSCLLTLKSSAQAPPDLTLSRTGAVLQTTWTEPAGVLQQADAIAGPWETVADALSPHSLGATNQAKFFRLVRGAGGDLVGNLSTMIPDGPAQSEARMPGVAVYLVNVVTLVPTGRATTDVNGVFIIPAQPPGHYRFCWEGPGIVSGCSTQHMAIVDDVAYMDPGAPIVLSNGATHAISGRLSFLEDSPFSRHDDFFQINFQTTVRMENDTGTVLGSALPNALGQFVLVGMPPQSFGNLIVQCESLSETSRVSLASASTGTLTLHNKPPRVHRVYASFGGQEVTRVPGGATVTLTAEADDGDADPIHYLWLPSLSQGSFVSTDSPSVQWTLPTAPGIYIMYVRVSDGRGGYDTARVRLNTSPERVFTGQVVDASGSPVVGALVSLGGVSTNTDDGGTFALKSANDGTYVISITRNGFAPVSQLYDEESAGRTYMMYRPEIFRPPSAAQDIHVIDSKGGEIFIPSNSLSRADGLPIVPPIVLGLTTVDPCNSLLESPVSNVGRDSNGSNSFFSSLSTMHVGLRDSSGASLTLSAGASAQLVLPLSSACASNLPTPPTDAGAWTYNLNTGTWTQTGAAAYRPSGQGLVAAYTLSATAVNLNTYTAADPSGPYSTITLTADRTLAMPFDIRVTGSMFAFTRTMFSSPMTLFFAPSTAVTFSVLNPKEAPGNFFSDPTNVLTVATPDTSKTVILRVITNSPAAYTGILVPLKLGLQVPALSTKVEVAEIFLTHNFGVGTATTATNYYAAIDPASQKTTLAAWKTMNGFNTGDEAAATYFNASDLGFGRQMHMKRKVGSDSNTDTAFYVSNFDTVDHARMGIGLIATVAMDYALDPAHTSLGRYTKFYVFDAGGNRVDRANLDGSGDKYVPNLCQICHGGNHGVSGTASTGWNLNAKFIPFDAESYTYSLATGYKPSAQHNAFRTMNLAIRDNTTPTTAITALINGWYGVSGTGTFNRDFVPTAWQGVTDLPVYRDVVKVSCRACHTTRGYDFTSPSSVSGCGNNVCNTLVMPDAQRTFSILWGSKTANVGGTGTPPNQPAMLSTRYGPSGWSPCP